MKFDDVLDLLIKSNKKVFNIYDAAKIMNKPVAYASLMLSKSKKVIRIERGRYFIKDTDIYEIASNIVYPSYISLHAGLQYYGLIDQNVIRYSVMTLKRHKNIDINMNLIEFIKLKREFFFGYVNKSNKYIATPEKLFIDCLYFAVKFSLLKDTIKNAMTENLINIGVLEDYAIRSEKKLLINKLGFLLSNIDIDSERLLPYRYQNYVHISDTGDNGINKKWRVVYD
ncbi:MAG: hypothetical protein M1481_00215 [Candidatus Thermoplasmatota archaeon]|jgi:predicted transcriptional regulator of viral defense system|nr:hypothetical protein [Candidatus Thermoplasmatota archaeon]MCL5963880.1 hypothetical protein [Candidatus Thermoplasmatota archaeon]